jgi:hypothetical protein
MNLKKIMSGEGKKKGQSQKVANYITLVIVMEISDCQGIEISKV